MILENDATEEIVVYIIAINTNAQPAEILASLTVGTVKNLTITCGNPAVPSIKAVVSINIFHKFPGSVYALKPKSNNA